MNRLFITGDMFYHPYLMATPNVLDFDEVEHNRAEQTHIKFIQDYADEPVLVLGTHISDLSTRLDSLTRTRGRVSIFFIRFDLDRAAPSFQCRPTNDAYIKPIKMRI